MNSGQDIRFDIDEEEGCVKVVMVMSADNEAEEEEDAVGSVDSSFELIEKPILKDDDETDTEMAKRITTTMMAPIDNDACSLPGGKRNSVGPGQEEQSFSDVDTNDQQARSRCHQESIDIGMFPLRAVAWNEGTQDDDSIAETITIAEAILEQEFSQEKNSFSPHSSHTTFTGTQGSRQLQRGLDAATVRNSSLTTSSDADWGLPKPSGRHNYRQTLGQLLRKEPTDDLGTSLQVHSDETAFLDSGGCPARCFDASGRRGQYTGACRGYLPHGIGRMQYSSDEVFDGEWKGGSWYRGSLTLGTGERYFGEFASFRIHGNGKHFAANGDQYEGNWMNGKRRGAGTCRYASGDVYSGEWHQDKRHGEGTYRHRTGWEISGIWENGVWSEQTKETYVDSHRELGNLLRSSRILCSRTCPLNRRANELLDTFVSLGGVQWLRCTTRIHNDEIIIQRVSKILARVAESRPSSTRMVSF